MNALELRAAKEAFNMLKIAHNDLERFNKGKQNTERNTDGFCRAMENIAKSISLIDDMRRSQ